MSRALCVHSECGDPATTMFGMLCEAHAEEFGQWLNNHVDEAAEAAATT